MGRPSIAISPWHRLSFLPFCYSSVITMGLLMNDLNIIVIVLAMAFSGVLLWFLIPRRKSLRAAGASFPPKVNDALPTAKHYGYFPQIRRALSVEDSQYLMATAPSHVAKQSLR